MVGNNLSTNTIQANGLIEPRTLLKHQPVGYKNTNKLRVQFYLVNGVSPVSSGKKNEN